MINSMTAFARCENKTPFGNISIEIRSVNQRYLETFFKMPENLRLLEPKFREKLRTNLSRGKVEFHLRFSTKKGENELELNQAQAASIIEMAKQINALSGENAPINPFEVLKSEGVLTPKEIDLDALSSEILSLTDKAITQLIEHRAREGESIYHMLTLRLDSIENLVLQTRAQMPEILTWQKNRLLNKFEEANLKPDMDRVEQEIVLLAQRIDVAEELDRLDSHLTEARNTLEQGGSCGRRLDFMMQEFNREANTLGSKSINAKITQASVELKVLIEQMREQIQNLE